ncbi:hypothetical protein E6H16_07685 [Candidatus Bathyarchaeota archaeon]|nr:MAG: hypothetical protein E6H16_07685 [Candidatus Bathyarchaeota archaeon]
MTVYPASAYKAAPPHEDDSLLVEMVKQLSAELGVPSMAPNSLVWAALVPKDMLDGSTRQAGRFTRIAPGDQVRFVSQAMFLPADLRGELRLEEWRPLIASSLIFRRIRWKLFLTKVALDWLPLSLTLVSLILPLYFFANRSYWLAAFALSVPAGIFVVGQAGYNMAHKRLMLSADRQAVKLVGKQPFLDVLKKIDGLMVEDIEWIKGRGRMRRALTIDRPGIDERIRNLDSV